jgi:hypothetical protein
MRGIVPARGGRRNRSTQERQPRAGSGTFDLET